MARATCNNCGSWAADAVDVKTELGTVTVLVCLRCDRAKCTGCNAPLPERALRCSACGAAVPAPDAKRLD